MHIAIVHPYSWPEVRRGAERYVGDLATYLVGAGHRVDIVTGTHASPSRSPGNPAVRRLRHRTHPALERRRVTAVETFGAVAVPTLVGRRFDVVHAMTPTAALAARAAGHRVVFTLLGLPTRRHFEHFAVERRVTRAAVQLSTAVVALSAAAAEATASVFGRAPGVLPPGVRLERFPLNPAPRTGPPAVLFSADPSDRRKGLDLVLAAFAHLLHRRPDARLRISGKGDQGWAVDELPADVRAAVEPAIDVLGAGNLDDVPCRYRDATVTVLPARQEAFGLVLVESLASGTPVVCAAAGGMTEIVDDPAVGRAVEPGNAHALAAALGEAIELASRPDTPARCAAHAQRWGWDAIGQVHEDLYRHVADGPRRPVGARTDRGSDRG